MLRFSPRKAALAAALFGFCTPLCSVSKAAVIWTFETSQPVVTGTTAPATGSYAPESGGDAGAGAKGVHASASTAYSTPTGNGSAHSFSSDHWAVGDYYQFTVTADPTATTYPITWDQTGSNTGPRDFKLQYSIDGGAYVDQTTYTVLGNGTAPNTSWNSTTPNSAYSYSATITASATSTFAIRFVDNSTTAINGTTVATGGTGRVDNVNIAVPEPTSVALLGLTATGMIRRRRAR